MKPENVNAIIVTKGDDIDREPIARTLVGFREVVFFEGLSTEPCEVKPGIFAPLLCDRDMKVFGRYGCALQMLQEWQDAGKHERLVVYVQDDDCVTDPEAICAAYEPGLVVCNMPPEFLKPNDRGYAANDSFAIQMVEEEECAQFRPATRASALVGFGAVFDADLIFPAMLRYLSHYRRDELFLIECDRIFTALNFTRFVDVPVRNLAHAKRPGRLSTLADHNQRYNEIRRRLEAMA